MAAQASGYIVQPVSKALRVLVHVAEKGHGVPLAEIAADVRLPKTTVFRYLQTLVAAEFLHHDMESDHYSVGHRFRALARADTSLQRLRNLALPEMAELRRAFNETINLGIMVDGHIVYIDMMESSHALRMQTRIGDRDPVHSTSLGKAMLAFLPEAECAALVRRSLRARTARTVIDQPTLLRQLAKTRRLGYAIEIGENEDGAMCIGAPILDGTGRPLAALSLSAPEKRLTRTVAATAAAALCDAARRISVRFGAPAG
ncbi:MAG: IclR family transcriptional regulator [Rhodospirillales bacterium]|nr:IclR family transcriptional regulator [Rhodospirillales bacterium]